MRHEADTTDGTQPSEPSGTFADPLAGPAGDAEHRSAASGTSSASKPGTATERAKRAAPDPERVRSLLNDVFAPTSEHASADREATTTTDTRTVEPSEDGGPVTPVELPREELRPGMLPRQRRTWPIRRRLTRQAWRPRNRTFTRRASPARAPRDGTPRGLKPTRGFAGVTIAVVLLLLFGFVALEFVVSFVGMFTGAGG